MSFPDPLVVNVNGVAKSLPRVDSGRYSSEYLLMEATGEYRAKIRNERSKPGIDGRASDRHVLSLKYTLFATATTLQQERMCSVSITHKAFDDITLVDDIAVGTAALITVGNVAKLGSFES